MNRPRPIIRSFALSIPAFDHLKDFQRSYERQHNVKLNNSETLIVLLSEHRRLSNGDCHAR